MPSRRSCWPALVLAFPLHAAQSGAAVHGVGTLFHPGSEAHWVIEQAGQHLGDCAARYEGEASLAGLRAHLFHERVQLDIPTPGGPLRQRTTVDLWTDDAGHPLRFELRAQNGDVQSSVAGTLAGGKAELVVHQGPSEKPVNVSVPADAFLLTNNSVGGLELLLALAPPSADTQSYTLFSGNVLRTVPYTLKRAAPAASGETVYEDSLGERLLVSGAELVRVEVAAQKIVMRRVVEPLEAFTLAEPARAPAAEDIEREDVRIVDGDVSLAGTITRRKGATGKLPAVFFLSGSGPQDRDGFSMGLDLGTHEILDRLTREGFLVLRVDDRGVGQSTGPLDDIDFDDLVADGRRCVHFLRARPDVDAARVALIGHSEGGVSAPILATSEPIAAVVLMAGPGRPLEELLREQLRRGRELQGAKPAELDAFGHELDDFLEKIAKGEPLAAEKLAPELAGFVPARAWLASHLGRDPLAVIKDVHCPVLILQGGRDVQVSAERDAPKLAAALDAAGNEDHEMRLFPALDHLFKKASGEHSSELDYLRARPIDPEFLDALVAWLRARLMR